MFFAAYTAIAIPYASIVVASILSTMRIGTDPFGGKFGDDAILGLIVAAIVGFITSIAAALCITPRESGRAGHTST